MFIEVKVKVSRAIDNKTRKTTDTFLVNQDLFAQAEYEAMQFLEAEKTDGVVQDYEIQSLRISPIKEYCVELQGPTPYIATLIDIWTDDKGNEKQLKYKVLLHADGLTDATKRAEQLSKQGYEMLVEGIKEATNFIILDSLTV